MTTSIVPTPLWLQRSTKFVAGSTLFLIFAGAMVTSTGSGLAVPDWPLSYGMIFPPMVGGIFFEHGHRMIAAAVGFLTVLQALLLQGYEPKRFVRKLGWAAVGAVIAQGLLGGLTVLFFLPPAVSIAHAALAEIFFCLNLSIAFFTSRFYLMLRDERSSADLCAAARLLTVMVYLQILAGALMRHLGAGLAIPDFPLNFGRLIPPLTTTAVIVNYVHRLGAAAVLLTVLVTAYRFRAAPRSLRRIFRLVALLLPLQVALGASTVWSGKNPLVTSLHVVTGAAVLGASLVTALAAAAMAPERAKRIASLTREATA